MKKIVIIIPWLFYSLASYCQNVTTDKALIPNLVPPSPNASSLGKYADWPVNLYTGTPSISIPLFSVQAKGITVPVSLNYHASGIKVGETASWVGLGWSLDAGGVITRSVRGLPDEIYPQGYFAVRKNFPVPGDLSLNPQPNFDSLYQAGAVQGKFDLESDIYMFNALGRSFKFYFSGNDSVVTQSASDVKIKWNYVNGDNLSNSSFEADFDDGTKLFFGGALGSKVTEVTTLQTNLNSYVSQANTFIVGWYLTKAISNDGDEVDFTYNSSTILQNSQSTETDYIAANTPICSCGSPVKNPTISFNTQSIGQLSIATIESPLVKLFFTRDSAQRLDLNGDYALKNIKVLSKLNNTYIQDTRFVYSYSTSSGGLVPGGALTSAPDTGSNTRRLKLMSVQSFFPNTLSETMEWDLTYNPTSLPSRRSAAQDHWGYNNGAVANQTLLPTIANFNPPNHKNGTREPDSNYVQAEMLTQIMYPTGGHSKFTYESNSYVTTQEVFQDTSIALHYDLDYPLQETTLSKSFSFSVSTVPQQVSFSLGGFYSANYIGNHALGNTMPSAVLKNTANSIIYTLSINSTGSTAQTQTLPPGNYTFTLTRDTTHILFPNDPNHSAVTANLTFQVSQGVQTFNKIVGGVRIRAIDDYDSVSSKVIHKSFIYEKPLLVAPIDVSTDYTNTFQEEVQSSGNPGGCAYAQNCFQSFTARSSSTKSSLGSIQGEIIGYGKVTTVFGANGENGKTISLFSNTSDNLVNWSRIFPYPPPTSFEWERGLLLSQSIYGADGSIKKRTDNNYQFTERDHITVCKAGRGLIYYHDGNYHGDAVGRSFYDHVCDNIQNISTTSTVFNSNGTDSSVTTTYNYWDNYNYTKPNRVERYDSKGYKHSEVIKYPKDYLQPGPSTGNLVLDSMISKNIFNVVEKRDSIITVSGRYIDKAQLNLYKVLPSGSVQLDKQYLLPLTSPITDFAPYNAATNSFDSRYSKEISFDSYDNYNNISQYTPKSASSSSFIWDYNGSYNVAEVKNAALSDIAYTGFEASTTGGWNISSSTRDSVTPAITGYKSYNLANGSISTASAINSSKTYILSYWSKAGSYTVTNGGVPKQGKTITVNGTAWTYFEHTITGTTTITISGANNIDELRLYPSVAQMSTYAYQPAIGLSNMADINNRITYYKYDSANRLVQTLDQDRNVIKKMAYVFANKSYFNVAKSQNFTDSCGPFSSGSTVTYSVAAGKYSSQTSQAAADLLAQNDINANGQQYANTHGTCTPITTSISSTVFGSISGFKVTFTNTGTSQTYQFTIPAAGGSLGTIPLGIYNITISKTGNTTTYYMSVNCDALATDGTSATFNNVTINASTCTTVHLDTRL